MNIENEIGWVWYPLKAAFKHTRWDENSESTKFVVCMLAVVIPATLAAMFVYYERTALILFIWWIGVVCISSAMIKRWYM